jgi:hypothetical protein
MVGQVQKQPAYLALLPVVLEQAGTPIRSIKNPVPAHIGLRHDSASNLHRHQRSAHCCELLGPMVRASSKDANRSASPVSVGE